MRLRQWFFVFLIAATGCSAHRFFYYPNRILYADPQRLGINHEVVHYPSLNGKKLWAVYFPTPEKVKGTVVHFHGNWGNLSNHFPLALFLLHKGYDVLAFDYQGYGGSEGRPAPKNLVEDGIATVRYAQARLRDPKGSVFILGQSLGGAAGLVTMAREPLVKAAVIEAAFSSHRRIGMTVMRRHWFTWPFAWPMAPFLGGTYDPIRYVDQIAPRPLLFIHGDADKIIPLEMSKALFDAAKEPKELWIIPGAGHLECRRKAGAEYEKKVAAFFDAASALGGSKMP
jgi:uncharacterized protein